MMYKFLATYEDKCSHTFIVHIKDAQTLRDAWVIASRVATEREGSSLMSLDYLSEDKE